MQSIAIQLVLTPGNMMLKSVLENSLGHYKEKPPKDEAVLFLRNTAMMNRGTRKDNAVLESINEYDKEVKGEYISYLEKAMDRIVKIKEIQDPKEQIQAFSTTVDDLLKILKLDIENDGRRQITCECCPSNKKEEMKEELN